VLQREFVTHFVRSQTADEQLFSPPLGSRFKSDIPSRDCQQTGKKFDNLLIGLAIDRWRNDGKLQTPIEEPAYPGFRCLRLDMQTDQNGSIG
jgi:hypothetical protein